TFNKKQIRKLLSTADVKMQPTENGFGIDIYDIDLVTIYFTWDGHGDNPLEVDADKCLGDFNMIPRGDEIGFGINIANSTGDVDITIVGYSTQDDSSELKQKIQATDSKVMVPFLFKDFTDNGNGADWTDLEAFVVSLDMTGTLDITIESIITTNISPEPVPTEVTVEFQVSASEDDGYAVNDNTQNLSSDFIRAGLSAFAGPPYYLSGIVFRNVDIPQGAEIVSASLKVRSYNSRLTDTVYGKIEAEASDNAAAFDSSRHIGSLPNTSASINWDIEEPWLADTWYTSPDIAYVIQEVINRDGWSSDNSLAIIYSTRQNEGGYRNISSYDRGSDSAPILEITYLSP
ncbi:hypothetical protein ACFL3Q_16570, partial [Planctomycetota bacterium]